MAFIERLGERIVCPAVGGFYCLIGRRQMYGSPRAKQAPDAFPALKLLNLIAAGNRRTQKTEYELRTAIEKSFTDGALQGQSGAWRLWAYAGLAAEKSLCCARVATRTNNRMDLNASIRGTRTLKKPAQVRWQDRFRIRHRKSPRVDGRNWKKRVLETASKHRVTERDSVDGACAL